MNDGPTAQRMREATRPVDEHQERGSMDTSDIAAAALKPDLKARCNCAGNSKYKKPIKTCEKCHGTGVVTACSYCGGSGWNATEQRKCSNCGGRGFISASPSSTPALE